MPTPEPSSTVRACGGRRGAAVLLLVKGERRREGVEAAVQSSVFGACMCIYVCAIDPPIRSTHPPPPPAAPSRTRLAAPTPRAGGHPPSSSRPTIWPGLLLLLRQMRRAAAVVVVLWCGWSLMGWRGVGCPSERWEAERASKAYIPRGQKRTSRRTQPQPRNTHAPSPSATVVDMGGTRRARHEGESSDVRRDLICSRHSLALALLGYALLGWCEPDPNPQPAPFARACVCVGINACVAVSGWID